MGLGHDCSSVRVMNQIFVVGINCAVDITTSFTALGLIDLDGMMFLENYVVLHGCNMCDSFLLRTDEKEAVIEEQFVVKGSDCFRTKNI
jgi:hypothetical protein